MILHPLSLLDVDLVIEKEQASTQYPWSTLNLSNSVANGIDSRLAKVNGQQIGYFVLSHAPGVCEIQNLVIFHPYQRKGYGARLLALVLEISEKQPRTEVWLDVRSGNLAARALYSNAGFTITGVRKNYYPMRNGEKEDALLMSWSGASVS